MILLRVRPPYRDDWTSVCISGEHEDAVSNLLISRALSLDYEVENEDGIPFEDLESEEV